MEQRDKPSEVAMITPRVCARCGTVASGYAPDGLCPKCLLLGGLGTDDSRDAVAAAHASDARLFGDYELLEEVAHGGMGIVYRARQISLNRILAVKLLLFGRFSAPEFVQRFRAEATAAAQLQHPNIVAIHEVGEHDGQHYFSMDFVEGQSLADIPQPLPARQAAEYLKRIAEAIHYAHDRGILHRDLKPSNVLIDQFGQPRITDFGLAKHLPTKSQPRDPSSEFDLTIPGQVLGSPGYMPPEQALGKREAMNRSSDVYSLGAILFHLLTGRPPFVAESLTETLDLVRHADPVSPRLLNPRAPRDLETICLKCLQKEPARRYQTAQDLADELGRYLRDEPIHARPAGIAGKVGRWCRRNPVVAGLGLSLVFVLGAGLVVSVTQWRRAERNAISARQGLVRLHIATGTRLAEENNPLGALVWLTEGLRIDKDASPEALDAHRRRLGWILRGAPRLVHLWAHDEPVNRAQFTPDGREIVITTGAAADAETSIHSVNVVEAESGRLVARFIPTNDPGLVNLTEDGRWLAACGRRGDVSIWNVANGARLVDFSAPAAGVKSVRFSPDARSVFSVMRDGSGRLFDTATGQPRASAIHLGSGVAFGEFSPDGRRIVTAGRNSQMRIWDASTGEPITDSLKLPGSPSRILFSPNSRWVFAGDASRTAGLFDAATGRRLVSGIPFDGYRPEVVFSSDSSRVAVATRDSFVRIWDRATGTLAAPPLRHEHAIFSLAFSPDGRWLATGAGDWLARIWDTTSGELVVPPLSHGGMVKHVAFNADGHRLATASADGTARVWDLAVEPLFAPVRSTAADQAIAAISANADRLAVGEARHVVLQPVQGTEPAMALQSAADVRNLAFSLDGRLLLSHATHLMQIWSAERGDLLATVPFSDRVNEARFTEDSQRIVTLAGGGCQLWDARTGRAVTALRKLNDSPRAFSPDGGLVVLPADGGARVCDLVADSSELLPHAGNLYRADFSQDGRRLLTLFAMASSSSEGPCVWKLREGNPRTPVLRLDQARRADVAIFSPNGKRIATASSDSTARVWDSENGRPLTPVLKHDHGVRGLKFSHDGKFLLTWTANQRLRIWHSHTGSPVTPPVHAPDIHEFRFSTDSRSLVGLGDARNWPFVVSFAAEPRPIGDLDRMAQLLGSHRLDGNGGVTPLPAGALQEKWEAVKARSAPDYVPTAEQVQAWHLQQFEQASTKRQWQAVAFHAKRWLANHSDDWRMRQQLRLAQGHLIRTGNLVVNATNLAALLPTRDARARHELIDLTSFYNGVLDEDVHPSSAGMQTGNNLAELPVGMQMFGGVEFDVRGLIRLYGSVFAQRGASYPEAVRNIPIARRAQKIHFLHGTGYGAEEGAEIGRLVMRFSDGREDGLPIIYGRQVLNWWSDPDSAGLADDTTVAWIGANERIRAQRRKIHLYRTTWVNPRPEVEIKSVDFISSRTPTGPFLIAITAEP